MTESKMDINEFLAEVEDIIAELTSNLVKLGQGIDAGRIEPDILNSIFRSAHTLKGISGMFGFAEMATITHKMEDMFDSMRMGRLSINHEIMNALFGAVDLISEMVVAKGKGEEFGIDRVAAIIAKFERLTGSSLSAVSEPSSDIDKGILAVLTEYEEHRLQENIKAGNSIFLIGAEFTLTVFDEGLVELTDYLKSVGEVIATLPSTGENKETLHFDILFGARLNAASVEEMFKGRNLVVKVVRGGGGDIEPSEASPVRDLSLNGARLEETTLRSVSNTVRVDIKKLDGIMNTVGELAQLKASISQIANKLRLEAGFTGTAIELSRIDKNLEKRLKELQTSMIEVRMVPIHQLFDKFTRVIRKLSKETGKEVELATSGGDTELDKLIIEDLADPLMHIIRNAIDHGIEIPTEREKRGKRAAGAISLTAYPKGNHVVIEVEDDGRGMNLEAIRKKAVERGLIDEVSSHAISRQGMLEFIFVSGVSTKDEVSEVSGRGVGMDVVKKNITSLSGTVDIDTEEGIGTRIILTLPITLAIIQALVTAAGAKRYAIPLAGVQEILNIRPSDIKTMEKKEVFVLRGRTIPVLRLEKFFTPSADSGQAIRQAQGDNVMVSLSNHEATDRGIQGQAEMCGIVVGFADSMLCILVDNIISQQDVVIKSLGKLLKVAGIAGATDLGDMGTLLVVDIAGIMTAAGKATGERAA
ncbi:MAG: chemotaxis protein CheA [Deltaproteobacteria bacterium]|nr:chemotaxis protein CheA [Deltaproteobacteria bacterium]